MKQKYIFLILISIYLSSCVITNTPGFYSGYKKLNDEEKSLIYFPSNDQNICSLSKSNKIASITASQLQKCLKNNDTALVYIWSPFCHSKICISIESCQIYCKQHGYKLYVVSTYYDMPKMTIQNTSNTPIFSINQQYNGTDYCNKYVNLFLKDLIKEKNISKNEFYNLFFYFKSDNYIGGKLDFFSEQTRRSLAAVNYSTLLDMI